MNAKKLRCCFFKRDPVSVTVAIAQAKERENDVVLVDTVGRMQNNNPLINALAKLAEKIDPDLVCFMGGALLRNVGIDQLKMFDSALSSRSGASSVKARHMNGLC
uniref:SRP54-type proteins GTP-binding domain-containing protein n=1 Tax=Proboscia inermis TaxID=420281 RepID=A0A7S0GFX4_9STRA|mmetsp:Transcript_44627/g.45126  ORF Transcript_44627/g.45126 Transcript_44627/m.45126 type:complete len:105 (+) Transcript_44627:351-665(+)